jgi:DNA-binding CsgD family transcriptional regulator
MRTPDATVGDIPHVSPREKQLLRRFANGKTDKQIAVELGGTPSGIGVQRQRIAEKFRIHTDEQLRAVASQLAKWPRPVKR